MLLLRFPLLICCGLAKFNFFNSWWYVHMHIVTLTITEGNNQWPDEGKIKTRMTRLWEVLPLGVVFTLFSCHGANDLNGKELPVKSLSIEDELGKENTSVKWCKRAVSAASCRLTSTLKRGSATSRLIKQNTTESQIWKCLKTKMAYLFKREGGGREDVRKVQKRYFIFWHAI